MKNEISKSNHRRAFFEARIDELRISAHERLKAKARLAQAEAMADALAAIGGGIRRLLRSLVIRPLRRLTTSLG
jgi:hypothetical protein